MIISETSNYKLKSYKDLVAWQKAYQLCLTTYQTTKLFPKEEQYGLTSQARRSSLSIPSNIAEGYSRHSTGDYIRFLYIAYSSLAELETQLLLARDLNYIDLTKFDHLIKDHQEVQRILSGLIRSIKTKSSNP